MAYLTGDIILDDEYNVFATGLASGAATDSANLNNVWGTGQADRGYGQTTTLSAVSAGQTVTATQWATLLARITSAASHQGSTITSMTTPVATDVIEVISAIENNLTVVHTNRLEATAVGTGSDTNIDSTGSWSVQAQQEITLTWSDPDEARYFFNAGGYIEIDPSIQGYTDDAKARSWDALTQMAGTIRFKAQGTTVTGATDSITVGGDAHTSTAATPSELIGYYDLTGTFQLIYEKVLDTSGSPYVSPYVSGTGTSVRIYAKTNGTQGSYQDNGTVVTLQIQLNDESTEDYYDKTDYNVLDIMDGTVRNTITATPPSTSYLTQTWSSPTVALDNSTHT